MGSAQGRGGAERDAQVQAFLRAEPAFRLEPDGSLRGQARVPGMAGRTYTFELEVLLPAEFPAPGFAPVVRIQGHNLGKPLTLDAHVFDSGVMCLQVTDSGDIPHERIGLSGFMQHVALHLDRIVIWRHTGRYPGPEVQHGVRGIEDYYRSRLSPALHSFLASDAVLPSRQATCPCGSGKRFRRCCHRYVISAAERLKWMRARAAQQVPSVASKA